MVDAVRPGGVVAVEDVDIAGAACHPPSAAFARTNELYSALGAGARRRPATSGSGCPGSCTAAGLIDVDVAVAQPAGLHGGRHAGPAAHAAQHPCRRRGRRPGHGRRARGAGAEPGAFVDRPDTVVTTARIVQSWGVAPSR